MSTEPIAELDFHYTYSSRDKRWAMYHAYLGHGDEWIDPPEEFLPKEEQHSRVAKLKSRSCEFLESFTAHGPFRVFDNRHIIRKLIWLLIFLTLLGFAMYQCALVLIEYYQLPTLTSLKVEHVTEPIPFPAVTFCNLNPLNTKSKLANHDVYGAFIKVQEDNIEPNCSLEFDELADPLDKDYCFEGDPDCDSETFYDVYGDEYYYDYYPYEYYYDSYATESPNSSYLSTDSTDYSSSTVDSSITNSGSTDTGVESSTDSSFSTATNSLESTTDTSMTSSQSSSSISDQQTTDSTANSVTSSTIGQNSESTTESSQMSSIISSSSAETTSSSGMNSDSSVGSATSSDTATTTTLSSSSITSSDSATDSSSNTDSATTPSSGTDSSGSASNTNTDITVTTASSGTDTTASGGSNSVTTSNGDTTPEISTISTVTTDSSQTSSADSTSDQSSGTASNSGTVTNTGTTVSSATDQTSLSSNTVTGSTDSSSGTQTSVTETSTVASTDSSTTETETSTAGARRKRSITTESSFLKGISHGLEYPIPAATKRPETHQWVPSFNFEIEDFPTDEEPLYRNKRSVNPEVEMPESLYSIRIACSFFFQYLAFVAEETKKITHSSGDTLDSRGIDLGDTSQCPRGVLTEKVSYNKICNQLIYEDEYGAYVNVTDIFIFNETSPGKGTFSCARNKTHVYDYNKMVVLAHADKVTEERVKTLIRKSRTNDLSDLSGRYTPNRADLENANNVRPPQDFLDTCSMNSRHCSFLHFHKILSEEYGICYTYNSPYLPIKDKNVTDEYLKQNFKGQASTLVGPKTGLRLTLNLISEDYVALLSPSVGLRVLIHDPWEAPFPEEGGFNLSPGQSHSVTVNRVRYVRAREPHGDCREDAFKKYNYTKTLCLKLCLEEQYRKRCGCKVSESEAYADLEGRDLEACNVFSYHTDSCIKAVDAYYNSKYMDCGCTDSCVQMVYTTQVTTTEENKDFLTIVRNVKDTDTGADVCAQNNSVVRVHIYLQSNELEVISETPAYSWTTLVSNVGGNLGLFIGMSIVSILELFDYLLDVILILISPALYDISHGRRHNRVMSQNQKRPRKVFVLAGPEEYLPHSNEDNYKVRPLRCKARRKEDFNRIFMSD